MWSQLTFHNQVFLSEIERYQDHHTAEQVTKKSSSWFWSHLFKSIILFTYCWKYNWYLVLIYVDIFLIRDNEIWFDHLTL